MADEPPPIPPRPPGYETVIPPPLPPRRPSDVPSSPHAAAPPQLPPRRQQPAHSDPAATTWSTPLLHRNGDPSPLFTSLMSDFFTVLDPQNTGCLMPEVFSGFLALNGFTRDEDPWRKNHRPLAPPFQAIDNADFELKLAYESWSFAYTLSPHPRSPHRPVLPYGGIPLLLREGFIAYLAVEFADDAPARCRGLNAALREYGDRLPPRWREMGPAPEWIFNDGMPEEVRRKIERANERSHRIVAERMEAVRVENALKAMGRRHAEELSGDYRYVYEYRY